MMIKYASKKSINTSRLEHSPKVRILYIFISTTRKKTSNWYARYNKKNGHIKFWQIKTNPNFGGG